MQTLEIIEILNDIFKDVLDKDSLMISATTSAADIEEWDSLNHIQLVVAIEKHFKIKFNTKEIYSWGNVGEIANAIHEKL